jgi:rfaE bifunctional protein nucleotidyltransferase chain/domain
MSCIEKIKSIEDVIKIITSEQAKNKTIVHAHGCFDLLHYGHLRFLEKSKELGDILVVSITSSNFINKGPGRPLFDNDQRSYQLANLESVDLVCVNYEPDACNLLQILKPDIAVRGSEYNDSKADITGKIDEEKSVIESVGGKMVFLDTPVHSSTVLINASTDHLSPELSEYKDRLQNIDIFPSVNEFFNKLKQTSLTLVGDLIIDEYIFANVLGTVSKHSAISASYKNNKIMGGGSLAIAKHISNFVYELGYIARVGSKSKEINNEILKDINSNISLQLIDEPDLYSVTKTRYIASGYSNPLSGKEKFKEENTDNRLFEISHLPHKIKNEVESKLISLLESNVTKSDLLIISDFGHGLLSQKIIKYLCGLDNFIALNVQTNSSNFGFNLITKYSRADFICIDEVEARLALGDRNKHIDLIAKDIFTMINCKNLMITRGKLGLNYYSKGKKFSSPALSNNVIDAVGAGDAVFAGASLCAFHDVNPEILVLISSIMGMLGTKIVGNERSIEAHEVIGNIEGFLKSSKL